MARTIKDPNERRNEILDAAQRLLYQKGYEQMTIQNILDEIQISRGALYHYFDSKQALLEGIIARSAEEGMQLIRPILTDPTLNAIQKLQTYFDSAVRWKTTQRTILMPILRVWYSDENALMRQKESAAGKLIMIPLLKDVLVQGVAEGLFTVPQPEYMAEVLVSLILGMSDTLGALILAGQTEPANLMQVEGTVTAYTYAIEQALGVDPNTLQLVDLETIKEWFA